MKLISLLIVARAVEKYKPNIYTISLQIPELFIF
jgi:hypothetical protein